MKSKLCQNIFRGKSALWGKIVNDWFQKSYMNVMWFPSRKITVINILYSLFIFKYLNNISMTRSIVRYFVINAAMHYQTWPSEWAKVERKYANIKWIGNFLCRRSTFALSIAGEIMRCSISRMVSVLCDVCKLWKEITNDWL